LLPSKYPYLHRAGTYANGYMQLSGTSMATPMVSGAVALLLQGSPTLSPVQVKLALQSGATFLPDGGLMGAGAGSMNVWASRKIAANGLGSLLTSLTSTLLGGVLTTPSGASFWDSGSLASNLHQGIAIRLLSSLDLSRLWANPSGLRSGQLNLAGLLNPLQFVSPNQMMYGGMTKATADDGDEITWGSTMHDSDGQEVVWGSSDDGDEITWGSSTTETDPDPR
jgi:Subtilase family